MIQNKKNKKIGKAKKRDYDLPFQKDVGTRYMTTVIGLMVFLGLLSAGLTVTLTTLTQRWTSGLEGHMTIEIPAYEPERTLMIRDETEDGIVTASDEANLSEEVSLNEDTLDEGLRSKTEMDALATSMIYRLQRQESVITAEKISNNDILDMVSPWLGNGSSLSILPVPVLIALEVQSDITEKQIENLQYIISTIDPAARLDTHQMWLNQILRFTGAIQMSIFVLVVVIALITIMAVAGVVRARLAAHVADVELLHLMGATDDYIARQFQGHILSLSLRGCLSGSLLSVAVIALISILSDMLNIGFLPDFSFGFFEIIMLLTVPCFILILGMLTAKRTVFSALRKMP